VCWPSTHRTYRDGTGEVLQRDVVYLGWPTSLSYMSPNAGGDGEGVGSCRQLAGSQLINIAVHRSPNKLRRSNSIFNLWDEQSNRTFFGQFKTNLVPYCRAKKWLGPTVLLPSAHQSKLLRWGIIGSFLVGTEDWTEKRRVFLRSEPQNVVYLRLAQWGGGPEISFKDESALS
jgi:hypothetical protein